MATQSEKPQTHQVAIIWPVPMNFIGAENLGKLTEIAMRYEACISWKPGMMVMDIISQGQITRILEVADEYQFLVYDSIHTAEQGLNTGSEEGLLNK